MFGAFHSEQLCKDGVKMAFTYFSDGKKEKHSVPSGDIACFLSFYLRRLLKAIFTQLFTTKYTFFCLYA